MHNYGESAVGQKLCYRCAYMTVTLPIKERTIGTKVEKVDLKVSIPAIVYGPKQAPLSVSVDRKEFEKLFKTAGESTVIELTGGKATVEVLVKDVSFAPIKGGIMHVDFYAIEKGKEIHTHVPLHFINEAPAVKAGAMINKVMHEVNVVCKVADLPSHLDVDLSLLETEEDKIKVSDIICPKGVKIEEEADDVVALAEAVRQEPETSAEPVDIAEIPVEHKGKEEVEVKD